MLTETMVKYLAGLLDADGSFSISFCKSKDTWYIQSAITLVVSTKMNTTFINSLPMTTGIGTVQVQKKEGQADCLVWNVARLADQEKLIPRIVKYMQIKAAHWSWLMECRRAFKGKSFNESEMAAFKTAQKDSRQNSGPLKSCKHPTWAWVAGYIDGDGCYFNKKGKSGSRIMRVSVSCHKQDIVAVKLLQKAFGGSITEVKNKNCVVWQRGLGPMHKQFAIKFLSKMVNHSFLKKHKIEQMLSRLNNYVSRTYSQRLTESTPTGEVIV